MTSSRERGAALALAHAAALERSGELAAVSRALIEASAELSEDRRRAAEARLPRRDRRADGRQAVHVLRAAAHGSIDFRRHTGPPHQRSLCLPLGATTPRKSC